MKKVMILLATGLLTIGCATQGEMRTPEASNMSHMHLGHVFKGWKDTPENKGLLPVARAEAEVTAKHAGIATNKLSDLAWMKTHTRHVIHAVEPGNIEKGPGAGYGLLNAAKGVSKHINLAANSADSSNAVKKHATHISMTANNTEARAVEILKHAGKVLTATSAKEAALHVNAMNDFAKQLLDGVDLNGDGKISWHKGEGGIIVAEKHMGALRKAEGI